MATYTLTTSDDTFIGTDSYDLFTGPAGGYDRLYGRGGDDVFQLEDGQSGLVSGGNGNDTVDVYGIHLGSVAFSSVETLDLISANVVYGDLSQLTSFKNIIASNGASYDTIHITGAGGGISFYTRWQAPAYLVVDATAATGAVTLVGTSGNDTFYGSYYADLLIGKGGNDSIIAHGADSVVNGGAGDDILHGAGADSKLYGSTGNDTLYAEATGVILHGGEGDDILVGTAVNTTLYGDSGNDTLTASAGGITLDGGNGADTFQVYADNTVVNGGYGNDLIYDHYSGAITIDAGAGNDTIVLYDCGCGSGTIDGGPGVDQADEFGIDLGARVFSNVETLVLSYYPVLYGSVDQFNSFQAIKTDNGAAYDVLYLTGAGGTIDFSTLWHSTAQLVVDAYHSTAAVTVTGTAAGDILSGSNYADTLNGGDGNDIIYGYGDHSILNGDAGNDTIYVNGGYSTVHGGDGRDVIHDNAGTSALYGDAGNDTFYISGGASSAAIDGGDGRDSVIELGTDLSSRTFSSVEELHLATFNYVTGSIAQFNSFTHIYDDSGLGTGTTLYVTGVGTLDLRDSWTDAKGLTIDASGAGSGVGITLIGSRHGDTIIGSAYNDILSGSSGDDTIYGGGGRNTIRGGIGDDILHAQGSGDRVSGGAGNDTLIDDSTNASTLSGGDGNDSLNGGAAADLMVGGAGSDTFVFSAVSDSDGLNYDRIKDFTSGTDSFDLWFTVTGVDATIASGALHGAAFTSDLEAAVDASHLEAYHAVLFTPDSGSLAGKTFMIVDANGTAGYQAGQDLVVRVDGVASLDVSDFI